MTKLYKSTIMTKEKIQPIAHTITNTYQRTVVTFKNGNKLIGYFERNSETYLNNENKWNFVKTPKENSLEVELINGDEILIIETITLY